jgi:hypothetical protein
MKGLFFKKPLEYSLNINGESWKQGDDISGTLAVKSHAVGVDAPASKVHLAYGHLKKAHAKDPAAFTVLQSAEANPEWTFKSDRNAPITDSIHSLFILYGSGDDLSNYGHIQLIVKPYWVIQDFLQELQVGFRFVIKTMKSSKGVLDVKVAPPDSRAFAALEQAILSFSFEEDLLNISARFDMKKIEATAASVDMKKEKKNFQKSYRPLDYLTSSGRFNHVQMEGAIREILDVAEQKILLK